MTWKMPHKPKALGVACPKCDAIADAECVGMQWKPGASSQVYRFHKERRALVRKVRAKSAPTRSDRAVAYMRKHGTSGLDAAKRFGISPQAVYQLWNKMELGPLPVTEGHLAQRVEFLAAVRDGMRTAPEIAKAMGLTLSAVRNLGARTGVEFAPVDVSTPMANIEVGFAVIRSGGTITEGAHAAGVRYQTFHKYMKASGVKSSATGGRNNLGRSEKAFALMERDGISAIEASHQVGMATSCFRKWLRRNGHLR